jgi:cytochrome c-type biogenesis protein CcmH/NrfG
MVTRPQDMSVDELANAINMPIGSEPQQTAKAEIARRLMVDQQQVKDAQIAADAAERNGWYMLASVVVALGAAIASAWSAYFAYLSVVNAH